ncbi:MAG: response regulator [Vicinamibacterales bacterium]
MPPILLLADDSVTIRRVIELTFADENITVVAVGDGDEAIARIDAAPPDIVLADIGMPGRSGYDIAEHIKRTPGLAHIPVVLLTGAFEAVDQARIGRVGCEGVLAKPFEPQVVVARVKELLSRPRGGPTPSGPPSSGPIRQPRAPHDPAALESYFDRLHAAFSNPSATPAAEIDLFRAGRATDRPAAPPADLPLAPAVPEDSKEPLMTNPTPPLADAFAALLAAERREPLSALPSTWPAAGGGAAASQSLADEATRRVLEQLSDKVVRETVTKVISQATEQLVKEEIDRIKGSIK